MLKLINVLFGFLLPINICLAVDCSSTSNVSIGQSIINEPQNENVDKYEGSYFNPNFINDVCIVKKRKGVNLSANAYYTINSDGNESNLPMEADTAWCIFKVTYYAISVKGTKEKKKIRLFVKDINSKETDEIVNNKSKTVGLFENCKDIIEIQIIASNGMPSYNGNPILYDTSRMFAGCSSLKKIKNLSFLPVIDVRSFNSMFAGCASLEEIICSNKWYTGYVEDMSDMFSGCKALKEIVGLKIWDTSKVKNMSGMFNDCESLEEINGIRYWNVSNVKDMSYMFGGCSALGEINISQWKTNDLEDTAYMFSACMSLTNLNLSNMNTQNVIRMEYMFSLCRELKSIDISNWNTSNVTSMRYMFEGCDGLENIKGRTRKYKRNRKS